MTPRLQPSGILPGGLLPVRDAFTGKDSSPYVELGWPGMDAKDPSLDIEIFDDSGSITAPVGGDPIGNRYSEAKRALTLVASWTATPKAKAAILHFDHPAGASGVFSLCRERSMLRRAHSLQVPSGAYGSSELLPSLMAAEALASEYEDHAIRLTVFSDFELTDSDPSGVLARLVSFPGQVHAVLLGRSAPAELQDGTVTITSVMPGDPPGTVAAALHRSLVSGRRGARHSLLHTTEGRRGRQVQP